jgi:hypothetical protein
MVSSRFVTRRADDATAPEPGLPAAWIVPLIVALVKLGIHLAAAGGYGIFRDELYYIACSKRLDWGYVDHPPLSILALRLVRVFLGESLRDLRLLPALAGAGSVFTAGWLARRLGGGAFAQALAATATLIMPAGLFLDHIFSLNSFDMLFWVLAASVLAAILGNPGPYPEAGGLVEPAQRRRWLVLGVVLGLGLMNKISVLWLGFGMLAGLLLTPQRRWLETRWPWLCAALAVALFSPYLIWQVAHGFPTLEFMRNAVAFKVEHLRPAAFLGQQVLLAHPLSLPLWAAGLGWLLAARAVRPWRALGILYLAVLALLMASGASKPYYLAPAYPVLFAAGGVAAERALELIGRRRGRRRTPLPRLQAAVLAILALGGLVIAPLALPILPVESFIRYSAALGIKAHSGERHELGALPQHFADMFGWEQMVEQVAQAWRKLPEGERAGAVIVAQNYGEAGAIEFFGPGHGLPRVISPHNNYWFWGPGEFSGQPLVVIGGREEDNRAACGSLEKVGEVHCGYCIPHENHQPISICRDLKIPPQELWPRIRLFI